MQKGLLKDQGRCALHKLRTMNKEAAGLAFGSRVCSDFHGKVHKQGSGAKRNAESSVCDCHQVFLVRLLVSILLLWATCLYNKTKERPTFNSLEATDISLTSLMMLNTVLVESALKSGAWKQVSGSIETHVHAHANEHRISTEFPLQRYSLYSQILWIGFSLYTLVHSIVYANKRTDAWFCRNVLSR